MNKGLEVDPAADIFAKRMNDLIFTSEQNNKISEDRNVERLVVSKPEIKKNYSIFPNFFLDKSNQEQITMWKIAAFKGSSYIYEDSSMRIGLKIPKTQKSFSDGTDLEITMAIMSKVINPLEVTLQCIGGLDMQIELRDKDFTIEPVARKILKMNFKLRSDTYSFPNL